MANITLGLIPDVFYLYVISIGILIAICHIADWTFILTVSVFEDF
jgi:hypothetical protein